jgi:hypothetical protein
MMVGKFQHLQQRVPKLKICRTTTKLCPWPLLRGPRRQETDSNNSPSTAQLID